MGNVVQISTSGFNQVLIQSNTTIFQTYEKPDCRKWHILLKKLQWYLFISYKHIYFLSRSKFYTLF